jgi:hypothetical protein
MKVELTPELKKKIEAHMDGADRLVRALTILDDMKNENEELEYLLTVELRITEMDDELWADAEKANQCPICGGPAPW